MSDPNETVISLTRREVQMVWDNLAPHVKVGRQRSENPLFFALGEIADLEHSRRPRTKEPPPPNWLTPEWREGFADELRRAGVLSDVR